MVKIFYIIGAFFVFFAVAGATDTIATERAKLNKESEEIDNEIAAAQYSFLYFEELCNRTRNEIKSLYYFGYTFSAKLKESELSTYKSAYDNARASYNALLSKRKETDRKLNALAIKEREELERVKAEREQERLKVKTYEERPRVFEKALAHYEAGYYELALTKLNQIKDTLFFEAEDKIPNDADIYLLLGKIYAKKHDYDNSIKYLEEASNLKCEEANALIAVCKSKRIESEIKRKEKRIKHTKDKRRNIPLEAVKNTILPGWGLAGPVSKGMDPKWYYLNIMVFGLGFGIGVPIIAYDFTADDYAPVSEKWKWGKEENKQFLYLSIGLYCVSWTVANLDSIIMGSSYNRPLNEKIKIVEEDIKNLKSQKKEQNRGP